MLKVLWPPDCPSKQARDTFHSVFCRRYFFGGKGNHILTSALGPSAGLTDKVFSFRPLKAVNITASRLPHDLSISAGTFCLLTAKHYLAVLKLLIPGRFKSDRVKLVSLDRLAWTVLCSQHNKGHQTSLADLHAPRTRNITHSCHN